MSNVLDEFEDEDIQEAIQASLGLQPAKRRRIRGGLDDDDRVDRRTRYIDKRRKQPAKARYNATRQEKRQQQPFDEARWVSDAEIKNRNDDLSSIPRFMDEQSRRRILNAAKYELNAPMIACAVCDRMHPPSPNSPYVGKSVDEWHWVYPHQTVQRLVPAALPAAFWTKLAIPPAANLPPSLRAMYNVANLFPNCEWVRCFSVVP